MSSGPRIHLSRAAREAYSALDAFSKTVGGIAGEAGIEPRLKELVQIHVSQLNGCAFCVREHVDRAVTAGVDADTIAQLATWRDSGVFSDRERAAFELAEAFVFIHEEGLPDELYDTVNEVLTADEYVAICWLLISINAFNRLAIAGRYKVPARTPEQA